VTEWWDTDYWRDHPDPSDNDIAELCRAWVRYQRAERSGGVDTDDPDWWACDAVMDLEAGATALWWRVLSGLSATVDPADEQVVEMIGAGPLEEFIGREGDAAMDLIEAATASDAVLVAALRSVWESREPVRSRIDRCLAAGSSSS
jgi:hypothetical protein